MNLSRRQALVALAAASAAMSLSGPAMADTTVHVSLWDKGMSSMDMMGRVKPMGMAMMGADMGMVTMGITLDLAEVPAGKITFEAVNDSRDLIHEMVLSPVADAAVELPFLVDEMKVDEDAAGHLGEVAEMEPGKSGALSVEMKPGTYILYCNIPGHYAMGMWTLLTVTE